VESPETAPEQDTPAPTRWFQRVLPVTAVVAVLIALGALLVPSFRDQLRLSTSREHQPYVELYFARSTAPDGQAVCTIKGGSARVRFVVASHLDKREAVAYRVAVIPTARGARAQRRAGAVRVSPGNDVAVLKSFALPGKGYTVSVRLPALGQQLRAHCPGRR
jgi:hypothetical protein